MHHQSATRSPAYLCKALNLPHRVSWVLGVLLGLGGATVLVSAQMHISTSDKSTDELGYWLAGMLWVAGLGIGISHHFGEPLASRLFSGQLHVRKLGMLGVCTGMALVTTPLLFIDINEIANATMASGFFFTLFLAITLKLILEALKNPETEDTFLKATIDPIEPDPVEPGEKAREFLTATRSLSQSPLKKLNSSKTYSKRSSKNFSLKSLSTWKKSSVITRSSTLQMLRNSMNKIYVSRFKRISAVPANRNVKIRTFFDDSAAQAGLSLYVDELPDDGEPIAVADHGIRSKPSFFAFSALYSDSAPVSVFMKWSFRFTALLLLVTTIVLSLISIFSLLDAVEDDYIFNESTAEEEEDGIRLAYLGAVMLGIILLLIGSTLMILSHGLGYLLSIERCRLRITRTHGWKAPSSSRALRDFGDERSEYDTSYNAGETQDFVGTIAISCGLFLLGPICFLFAQEDEGLQSTRVYASVLLIGIYFLMQNWVTALYIRVRTADRYQSKLNLSTRRMRLRHYKSKHSFARVFTIRHFSWTLLFLFPQLICLFTVIDTILIEDDIQPADFIPLTFPIVYWISKKLLCLCFCVKMNRTSKLLHPKYCLLLFTILYSYLSNHTQTQNIYTIALFADLLGVLLRTSLPLESSFWLDVQLSSSNQDEDNMNQKNHSYSTIPDGNSTGIRTSIRMNTALSGKLFLNMCPLPASNMQDPVTAAKFAKSQSKVSQLFRNRREDLFLSAVLSSATDLTHSLEGVMELFENDEGFLQTAFNLADTLRDQLDFEAVQFIFNEIHTNRFVYIRNAKLGVVFSEKYVRLHEEQGMLSEAVAMLGDVLTMKAEIYGGQHISVSYALVQKALLCMRLDGELKEAMKCIKTALQFKKKFFKATGMFSKAFVSDINFLKAQILCQIGDFEDAFSLLEEIREAKVSLFHGKTESIKYERLRAILKVLATVFEEAKQVSLKHLTVILVLYNISLYLIFKGDLKLAVRILSNSLEIAIDSLGYYHEVVVDIMDTVAEVNAQQELFEEALTFQKESLHILDKLYDSGTEMRNPVLSVFAHRVGIRLQVCGKHEEAIGYFKDSLLLKRRTFPGDFHPSIGDTLSKLSMSYMKISRTQEALETITEATEVYVDVFGRVHHKVSSAMKAKSRILRVLEETGQSVMLIRSALKIDEKLYGRESLEASETKVDLATMLLSLGKKEEAREVFEGVLPIQVKLFDEESAQVSDTRQALKSLRPAKKERKNSAINPFSFPSMSANMEEAVALSGMAEVVMRDPRELDEAIEMLERSLSLIIEELGVHNPTIERITVLKLLTKAYKLKKDNDQLLGLLQDCLSDEMQLFGNESAEANSTRVEIEKLYLGNNPNAIPLRERLNNAAK